MYNRENNAHNKVMRYKKIIAAFLLTACAAVPFAFNYTPYEAQAEQKTLYLGGFPAGFMLNTTSVQVVGLCEVSAKNGLFSPARDCGIKTGDIIESINGVAVTSSGDVNKIIAEDYKKYEITIKRGDETIKMNITPVVEVSSGNKRLGMLVKDSINGVGTVTYIDKTDGKFASLGHPVTDTDSNLIEINGGCVYGCLIYGIKKGVRGTPGELKGAFDSSTILGNVRLNSPCGVFGDLSSDFDETTLISVSTASLSEVTPGKAFIYTTLSGDKAQKYEISIVKVDENNKDNRNFVIKIDDDELIEKTGGIVQGMSGSPIIQNDKLVGAITHVFVNDPTRGYGIGIEKMMEAY